MNRQPVKSSNIKSVGYDAGTRTLEVEFSNGAVHQYLHVPPATHQALLKAKSVGGFFHGKIRSKFKNRALE